MGPNNVSENTVRKALAALAAAAVITVSGVAVATLSSTGATFSVPVLLPNGTAAAPSLVFDTTDIHSGLYWVSNDTIGIATAGVDRVDVNTTGVASVLPITETTTALAATTAAGLTLTNTTDSTADATVQASPSAVWHGEAWDTGGGGAGNNTEEWQAYVLPASGATVGSSWILRRRQNADAFADKVTVTSGGNIYAGDYNGVIGTFSGDVAVNGDDITCDNATSCSLYNTTTASVVIGGAATTTLINGGSGSTGATFTDGALDLAGDISAAGGFKVMTPGTLISNVPQNNFAASPEDAVAITPSAGSVVGISCMLKTDLIDTAGTVTCAPDIDGAGTCTATVQFGTSDVAYAVKSATVAKDTANCTFAAGKVLKARCTGSADLNPADTDYRCFVAYEF